MQQTADRLGEQHCYKVDRQGDCHGNHAGKISVQSGIGDHDGDGSRSGDQRSGKRDHGEFVEVLPHFVFPLLKEPSFPDCQPADDEDHQPAGDLKSIQINAEYLFQHEEPDEFKQHQHQKCRAG